MMDISIRKRQSNAFWHKCILMLGLLTYLGINESFSEGTAQWMPTGMAAGQEMSIMLYNSTDGNGRLGTTGCDLEERINIRVSSNFANERIYIGMNVFDNTASFFRVMDPNGNQVYPTPAGTLQAVLSSGAGNTGEGYIATLTEARNGPEEVFGAGGFDAISITPTMAGDYYIEFNGANSTTFSSTGRHQVSYFDVTVANTNGLVEGLGNHTAINGRLNALQWGLYNLTDGLGFNNVDAEFFLYQSDDSLVISIDWNQVKAGGWDIAFTRNGLQNTGNYFTDRQSQPYSVIGKGSVVGEFPIFVNDPDNTEYPGADELPKLTFLEYDRCSGSTCFLYNITKGGQVEVLIDLNENGMYDPGTSDRLLVDNKPAGTHCLAWDDLDGLGDLIVSGQAQAVIKYQAGIFHMPLGDVEANTNGFNRGLVRPLSFLVGAEEGRIYYDHSQVGGAFAATDFDFDGCVSNCNTWSPNDGNINYLNTWLSFAELRDTLIVTFNSCDKDEDGLSDVLDIDDDNDGIPDIMEMYKGDHDNDGTPDYEDADFCTATFEGVNGWSCSDGLPDPSGDLDGDGIRNALDSDFPNCGTSVGGACSGYDSDLDGVPDYLDRDSDNDGISDLIEVGGTDTDGDGVVDDLTDTDGDGLADIYDNNDTDGPSGSGTCATQPGCLQGVSTNPLFDTNNDGSTNNERDSDGDGLADYIDLDSDNDGIPDVVEVGGTDTDGDGFADNFVDVDGDGFNDIPDGQICADSTDIGTATYVDGSSTGVDNGTNASGQPDAAFAGLYQAADAMVVDFGVNLPVGTQYVITWRRKSTYTNTATADMDVEESLSPGASYTTNTVTAQTTSRTDFVQTVMTSENLLRYLRFSISTDSNDDVDFDAVKYFYNEETCVAGNPILLTGADTDNDGVPNSYPSDNADGDALLNHLDLDSDNDGIPDVVEVGGTDVNGDGRADDYVDADADGFNDVLDGDVGNNGTAENSSDALVLTGADSDNNGTPNSFPNDDNDGDNLYNFIDLDADNDGIADVVEVGGTDVNGDGRADDYADADGDGFNDVVDGDPTNALALANDGAGANTADVLLATGDDTDGDGSPNSNPNDELDGDNVYNFLDLDSDGDGILDVIEAGGTDADRDGIEDSYTDVDGDGFNDNVDGDPDNSLAVGSDATDSNLAGVTTATGDDTDGDGVPNSYPNDDFDGDNRYNFIDIDADNDGIVDNTEGQGTSTYVAPAGSDSDGDGIDDAYDSDDANFGGVASSFVLSDIDSADDPNSPDYLDLNSDNDGVDDIIEGHDTNGDGIADASSPANTGVSDGSTDEDGDGLLDGYDNNTSSTDPTNGGLEGDNHPDQSNPITTERDWRERPDWDKDGIPDADDLDDDNDGIADSEEGSCGATSTLGIDNNTTATTFDGDLILGVNTFTGFSTSDGTNYNVIITTSIENNSPTVGNGITGDGTIDGVNSIAINGERLKINFVNAGTGLPIGLSGFDFRIGDFEDLGGFGENIPEFSYKTIQGDQRFFGSGNWTGWEGTNGIVFGQGGSQLSTNADGDLVTTYAGAGGNQSGKYARLNVPGEFISEIVVSQHNTSGGCWFGWASTTFRTECDSDNDGIPNYLDLDSDNDGIPDIIEAGGEDTDGNGKVDDINTNGTLTADTDGDGLSDLYDNDNGGIAISNGDKDGDGIPNALDLDADNDGIPDVTESNGTDVNGDGRADNFIDADNDGFNDAVDGDVGQDGVSENSADALILTGADTDNDGVPNSFPNNDFDEDNILNYLDLDSDDDGILDVTEAGGQDTNLDGQADNFADTDNDGFNDEVDGDSNNSIAVGDDTVESDAANALLLTGTDTDGNGNPNSFPNDDFDGDNRYNFIDIDADNDGITDNTEGQGTSNYIAPANADADGDGIDDAYDSNDAAFGGENSSFIPSDIDDFTDPNSPDYLDLDADGDGELDAIEGHDTNGDGTADGSSPSNTGLSGGTADIDNDGLYDGWDNNTSSNDPTNTNLQGTSHPDFDVNLAERDWREFNCIDSDGDGVCNKDDIDDDNDGVLDTVENNCGSTETLTFGNSLSTNTIDGDLVLGLNTQTGFVTSDGTAFNVVITTSIESKSVTQGDGVSTFTTIDGHPAIAINGERVNIKFVNTSTGNPVALGGFDFRISDFETDGTFLETLYKFSYKTAEGVDVNYGSGYWTGWEGANGIAFGSPSSQLGSDASGKLTTNYTGAAGNQTGKYARLNIPNVFISEITFAQHNSNGGSFFGWANNSLAAVCDADEDGIPNQIDLDSDNDGIPDIIEAGGIDVNNDGRVDVFVDGDNDGWANTFDSNNGGTALVDGDKDNDGLPNRIDIDADNDGIVDIIEAGGTDSNNDGRVDVFVDGDGDGWANSFDSDNGGTSLPIADLDGDGIENYLDLDSDSDGITDNVEGQTTLAFQAPLGADGDNDGWDNRYDSDDGGIAITLSDNESAGNPDYLDLDSDGDGLLDWIEGFDDNNTDDALDDLILRADNYESSAGNPLHYVTSDDTDNDGIPNFLEDADLDGTPNFLDPDSPFYVDTDNDGLVNLVDSDNNGTPSTTPDGNGDGEFDFRDTDNEISLPVELIEFNAIKNGDNVILSWKTASEINNDYFIVERSIDGKNFQTILKQKGNGNKNTETFYLDNDFDPQNGINYYRLAQIDFDGKTKVYNDQIRMIKMENKSQYKLFPIPSNGERLFLESSQLIEEDVVIQIISAQGQLLEQRQINSDEGRRVKILEGSTLSKGMYFLKIRNKKSAESIVFIISD